MRVVGPLLLGLLFLAACDSNTAGTSGATVSDSAGVEVVSTNDEPAWAAEDAWYLADAPRLQLGTVEGDPAYRFDRIMGAVTLSDGRIAVADMGSSEVRLFDVEYVQLYDLAKPWPVVSACSGPASGSPARRRRVVESNFGPRVNVAPREMG